jgi:hypothetical protein
MFTHSSTRTTGYSFPKLISFISVSLLILFNEATAGNNYYFSSSTGDDARTSIQARNPATPWKTITKLNSFFSSLSAGDSVLFKKNDIFEGTITPTISGTLTSPIIISSYGSGAKPVISGFQTVTGWTNEGSGIYSKAVTVQSTPSILMLNGVNAPMGRFPKSTYRSIDSHSGSTVIVDAGTPSSVINWTGADVVIRKNHWMWEHFAVTNHSGNTITYAGTGYAAPEDGLGFYFQNDLRCLSSYGDWAYKSGKLYMYFGADNPESQIVKIPVLDRLIILTARNYITIENLTLQGANKDGIYSTGIHNTISKCNIMYIGDNGVQAASGSTYLTIDSCIIAECNNRGVYSTVTYTTVRRSYVHNIAMRRGMGGNGNGTYTGIGLIASGANVANGLIEYNRVDSIGYNGITFNNSNSITRFNYVTNYCNFLDDGAGIYTSGSTATGRMIYNNIVINNSNITAAQGVPGATGVDVNGIYLDNNSANILVFNNTSANNQTAGIFLHNAHEIEVHDNICYNNSSQILYSRSSGMDAMLNNNVSRNQLFSKTATQFVSEHATSANDVTTIGTIDSNYYCRPLAETNMFRTILANATSSKTLAQWKTYSGKDSHSQGTPISSTEFLFEYATSVNRTIPLTGIWKTLGNVSVSGSITLQPYTSVILIKSADINTNHAPIIENQSFQLDENKPNGTTVGTVVASDPDAGQAKTFSLVTGNTNGAFAINASTGVLTVADATAINFEVTPTFALIVKVQDNGTGNLSSQANITVSLIDINEVPVIGNQSFSVIENSANGTTVGTINSIDPDAGQTSTISIVSGNTNNAFAINASTGVITVANTTALNFGITPSFTLVIKVQDNGTGLLSSQANIIVNLLTTTGCTATGNITYQVWNNIGNSISVSSLTSNVNYPNNPTSTILITSMEGTTNLAELFGARIAGYICAPITGNYSFWIASDDNSELWLSTDNQPTNKQKIAYHLSYTAPREWNKYATQKSATIHLTQGQSYYIEALMKDGGAGDNLSVGWLKPGQTGSEPSEVIPGSVLSPLFESANLVPVITNQSFSVNENSASASTVGTVVATDPDAGQIKTFSIVSGNTNSAFAINATTGVLTVAAAAALNFEVTPAFALVIKVQDNGTGNLSSQATITISLTDVNEAPAISNQSFSIAENSSNGTTVGTVIAADPDAGQTKTFSILSGNANSTFVINSSTGVLTVTNTATSNFEVTPSFTLVVKVQDNGTGNLSSQATITVSLADVNEAPAISNQSFSITENSSNGTTVGTVIAADPDAGQVLSYSILSGNVNGAFSINASNGVLTVANEAALNFELSPSFALVIKVQDNGIGNLNSQATLTISLLDVNEEPVINNQLFSITENSPNATYIGTVIATDPDSGQTMTFSIASGNTNGAIAINASTGALVVANQAALNFIINPTFSLGVKVTDNGTGNLFKIANVTVSVLPIPNQPPVIINQTFTLNQNSPTGTSVGIVTATDPDAGQKLVYSILSGNTEGAFTINSSTGEILVSNSTTFHIKSSSSFALVVQVHDNGSVILSNQATVTVVMLAANEPPLILNQTKSTLEHQPIGTIVGNISAYDPDSGIPVIFSITSGNIGNGFAIDANNGNLTINNPAAVCYEGNPVFNLNVKVQDNEGLTSEAIITVNVADINEKPLCNNQIFTINENAPEQTLIGSIVATENDFNQTLTYSIVSGNLQDAFTIDGSNGSIKVNNTSVLNFERDKEFSLIVSVQDNGLGNLSTLTTITIKLIDVNESPEMGNQVLSVVENSAAGTEIGYLKASDPDTLQTVKYMIVGGNESQIFSLNATSGLLSIADPSNLNYGRNPLSTLTVIAQDNGTDSLSTLSIITINILRDSSQIIQTEGVSPAVNVFDEKDITIYPNPTSDFVNIDLGELVDKQVSTRIINMNGIEVFSSVTKGEKKVVISMIDKKPGNYVAVITTDGQKYSRNFIVQN